MNKRIIDLEEGGGEGTGDRRIERQRGWKDRDRGIERQRGWKDRDRGI